MGNGRSSSARSSGSKLVRVGALGAAAVLLTAACVLSCFAVGGLVMRVGLGVIMAGSAVTVAVRLSRMGRQLRER